MSTGFGRNAALLGTLAVVMSGCASVKTRPAGASSETTRLRRPAVIHVQPFATTGGMWQKSASSPERRLEIRDWLTGRLLLHLSSLAPTHVLDAEATPSTGWLVAGRFLRVNPGSRVARMFLGGVGAGASKLETRVDVFDLAVSDAEPMVSFTTTGGSNLAVGLPGAMAATDDDVDRTAREIHAFLAARLWPADEPPVEDEPPRPMGEINIGPPSRGRR